MISSKSNKIQIPLKIETNKNKKITWREIKQRHKLIVKKVIFENKEINQCSNSKLKSFILINLCKDNLHVSIFASVVTLMTMDIFLNDLKNVSLIFEWCGYYYFYCYINIYMMSSLTWMNDFHSIGW